MEKLTTPSMNVCTISFSAINMKLITQVNKPMYIDVQESLDIHQKPKRRKPKMNTDP